MSEERASLSADSPLKHPNEDELGYARFAEQLVHTVVRMAPNDGLVMSVNGSWGSGKSTVLNFMLHYLEQVEEDKRPVVVRFNPWWFSGREDLARLLIGQICTALGEKESEGNRKLKKYLSDFTDLVSKLPSIPGVTPLSWLKTGKFFTDSLFKQPSLSELKEKIDNLLTTRSKKILVFVDDIDRLSPDEIRDLFRAIKATANFPNTIYLLAFDTQVVTKALEQGYFASGQQYLEKIIQVPFELPRPDKVTLRQLLFSKLDQIITNTPEHLFDQMYWTNIYFDGIDHLIKTPREIVRLINVLRATYSAVRGEVNPVDFIAIEAFRVFRPEIYDIIRTNESFLTGASDPSERNGQEKYQEIYKSWIDQVPERDQKAVERMLVRLFPRLRLFSNIICSSDVSSTWRKNLRICSPEIFPIYFRFNVSEDSITASEMQMLLNASHSPIDFEQKLINFSSQIRRDGTTRLRAILERFEDYTKEDIPTQNIEPIILALFKVGDELLKKEDDHRGMFDFSNDMRIGRIVYQLLFRLEEEQRFQILYKAIGEGAALSISEREVSVLGQQHGKFTNSEPKPESERFINAEHLSLLEQLVLGKIREAAKLGILLKTPKLTSILWRWKAWSENNDEVKQWVADVTKDDRNLAIFIEHFGNIHHVHSQGNLSSSPELHLEPKRLEPFINPDEIIERIRRMINRNDLPDEQIGTAKQFVKEYDLLSQGKDPDDQW